MDIYPEHFTKLGKTKNLVNFVFKHAETLKCHKQDGRWSVMVEFKLGIFKTSVVGSGEGYNFLDAVYYATQRLVNKAGSVV